ncbi:MAG TPA: MDR family MFS transporter [Nocardioidaceae bacterium]|nr:MDR family MFS transporter [Nocardioidaceae bacterium]
MTTLNEPTDLFEGRTMPARTETTSDAEADYGVLRWLVLATFIVILNETLMFNAIPRLIVEFDVTARTAQWLSTAFMLTMAVVIPITGWFLQRVNTRTAFTTAMVTFCTGTLLAAVAPTFGVLLVGRVIQASGTAVMMPLLMTTLMMVVAEHDRGRVMGNVTLAISVAPALGPAVSGVILDLASWRWMFGLVLPIAIAISVVSLRSLENVGETNESPIDWLSVALAAVGFGPLVYGLSQLGADNPAVSPVITLLVGVVAVVAFVLRQLQLQKVDAPLLDLRTLLHRTYTLGLILMAVAFMAMMGSFFLLPLYLQNVVGLTELETGLLLMPGGLAMGLLGPRVGKVFDKVGGRPLVIPGAVAILVSLSLFSQVDAGTSVWFLLPVHLLMMVGLAALFTPVFTLSLGAVPPQLYSHASSVLGTLQQVAAAIGTAVVVTVVTARSTSLADGGSSAVDATVGGLQWGFGIGAILAVALVAIALVMPGRVPGATGHAPVSDEDDELEAVA